MNNLLKANFYKLLKDKSTYILAGVSVIISLVAIVIYKVAGSVAVDGIVVSDLANGKTLFLSGIQLGQNAGMLLPLGVAMFIGKEFSQNTIRNKVVIGYSKTKIYLANLIMSVTISAILYLVYELVVFAVGIPMFGWGETFVFGEFMRQLINSLLILITLSAVITMISMLSRNLTAAILISMLGVVMVSAILSGVYMIPMADGAKSVMEVIMKTTFLGQSALIATENSVSFMIWVIVSSIIVTAGVTVLGCRLFEKLDLK